MRNRLSLWILLCLVCLAGVNSLWGQDAQAPVTTVTYAGKFVVKFTITVNSAIAATNKIACTVSASVLDAGTANNINETAGNSVVRGSGSTVVCTATLPYSWSLATGTIDKVNLSYIIQAPVLVGTGGSAYPIRLSGQSIGSISVPANGTTTNYSLTPTI